MIAKDAIEPVSTVGDPIAAGKAEVAKLRKEGAQVIVALVQAPPSATP